MRRFRPFSSSVYCRMKYWACRKNLRKVSKHSGYRLWMSSGKKLSISWNMSTARMSTSGSVLSSFVSLFEVKWRFAISVLFDQRRNIKALRCRIQKLCKDDAFVRSTSQWSSCGNGRWITRLTLPYSSLIYLFFCKPKRTDWLQSTFTAQFLTSRLFFPINKNLSSISIRTAAVLQQIGANLQLHCHWFFRRLIGNSRNLQGSD